MSDTFDSEFFPEFFPNTTAGVSAHARTWIHARLDWNISEVLSVEAGRTCAKQKASLLLPESKTGPAVVAHGATSALPSLARSAFTSESSIFSLHFLVVS